jgi:hypothetical protein
MIDSVDEMDTDPPQTAFLITCPYCGEEVEIYLEPDIRGELVLDCEVCCQPWAVRVSSDVEGRSVDVTRDDGGD